MSQSTRAGNWVAQVQRFVRSRDAPEIFCELCAAPIAACHRHVAELAKRRLLCVCSACAMSFATQNDGPYRAVPEAVRRLENLRLTDAEWDSIGVPINLAFFVRSSARNRVVAFYLGPAGPTESLLDLQAWEGLAMANQVLLDLEPDVEALLANHMDHRREYYRAPIDVCYALAGLIKIKWRGFSGGEEARQAIDSFFDSLRVAPESVMGLYHG
jgi:hypothetical protein